VDRVDNLQGDVRDQVADGVDEMTEVVKDAIRWILNKGGGRMKNKNCEERNELHEKFALATISYVAQISKVMAAALLSDPSQFVQAREEEREAERLYRQASDAFLRHREERKTISDVGRIASEQEMLGFQSMALDKRRIFYAFKELENCALQAHV
jgi:hypothetical protein